MLPDCRIILSSPPEQVQAALVFGLPVAHMAYRVGPGLQLLRTQLPVSVKGGLMMADSTGFDETGDVEHFCKDVMRECVGRSFDGVILDFEAFPSPLLGKAVSRLAGLMAKKRWPLYVPESYASYSSRTKIIIPSALSGGSLGRRLSESVEAYGADRVTLGLERVTEDFFLPAPNGRGMPLSRQALQKQISERSPSVFFSKELCANYFTYMSKQTGAHFVLFDDAATIRHKLRIAAKLKIRDAILAYPQVDDILEPILAQA